MLTRALWTSIAITYRRGFAGGSGQLGTGRSRRNVPRGFVNQLAPELISTHDMLMELANRHIAHRVDEQSEHFRTVLLLQGEPEPKGVAGYGELAAIKIGADSAAIELIGRLARELRMAVETEVRVATERLFQAIDGIDVDTLVRPRRRTGSQLDVRLAIPPGAPETSRRGCLKSRNL